MHGVLDFIMAMFYATFEGIFIYSFATYVFRMDFKKFLWPSLIVIELINLQSYITYETTSYANVISPLLNIILTIIFFKFVVRVPILWATFMTAVGFVAFWGVQVVLIYSIFGNVDAVRDNEAYGHITQVLTGAIGFVIGHVLYSRGYGFTYEFEKLRFRLERNLLLVLMICLIIGIAVLMYYSNLYLNFIGFLLSFGLCLYYAFRKEQESHK